MPARPTPRRTLSSPEDTRMKKSMRMIRILGYVTLAGLVWSTPQTAAAQEGSLGNYLLTAFPDAENTISPSYSSFTDHNSSWVDEPEARFGFNDDQERSYALRLRPRFSKERSFENSLVQLRRQQEKVFYDIALSEALQRRYKTILALLRHQVEVEFLEQNSRLALSEVKYLKSISQMQNFRISQLQDAESRYRGIRQKIALHTSRLGTLLMQVFHAPQSGKLLEVQQYREWLMPLDDLPEVMERIPGDVRMDDMDSNPYIRSDSINLQIESENVNYERSISNSPIEFVEIKYIDRINDESAVTLGFSLPFGKARSYRNLARQARVVDAEIGLQRAQQNLRDRLTDVKNRINWFLEEAKYLDGDIAEADSRLQRTAQLRDPQLLLNLRENALLARHRRSRLHIDALEAYIDFLQMSGKLIEPPIRNVIDASRPVLDLASLH